MGSATRQIAKRLKEYKKIQDAIKLERLTTYNRGLYNGLELAISILTDRTPNYLKKESSNVLEKKKKCNK